ncbi:glycosyltransferase [Thetidibacter halocola]|uniref:Glycosyltransferase n=1 Tax=Thetidibacter halocola TaxID=2827239 RepID=A0A8J8B761_9RHOB|nr:glycosyltransferase [Thetidibacter halocola]MBS0123394.1 glycosyltransferase [Thetidibacter halocola]
MTLVSVIVPASNEAALIGRCLDALAASRWPRCETVQVVVVANGCRDDTAGIARGRADAIGARGWRLDVIERAEGGKLAALNAGDAAATGPIRVYLDADVTVSPDLLAGIADALDTDAPRYASGRVRITARGVVARAYARIWRQVPFMVQGVPGCGVFAVNAAGRARWGAFPDIIADDLFVRLSFTPAERVGVPQSYDWPIAEDLPALIRVRRRQDAGVDEIARRFPALMANEDKMPFPVKRKLRLALRDPLGFAVYATVALASRLTRHHAQGWSRGR